MSVSPQNQSPLNQTALGIGLMVLAAAVFGMMDALVKWLTAGYSTVQIMFFRSVFAFPPILMLLWRNHGMAGLRTQNFIGHGLRSIYGCLAMLCFFSAYATMPLADVTAIAFAAPVFIACLSVWLLGERVGLHRWSAIVVGFLGMLVILRPAALLSGHASPGLLLAAAGTLLYSLAMIQIRKLTRHEASPTIAFYFTAFCTLYTGLALPWFWTTPDLADLGLLIAVGLLGGMAQLLMTRAFSLAAVSVVAPFDYTHLLWSVLLGWYLFGDFPDLQTWIGSAIVVASGLYILYRETVRRREPVQGQD
ncbi:DMT family transporter [Ferrovibrio sp.]|uniref:DMT family transporter n=1 Tax=Ferrovibrio sp. TaxID=1917215 RepID=UPI0025C2F3E1|nr:DMT family transporter [Ferrovibrio sp.]MBX3453415.1 DMT family transporter [Ferrovibrio sp.]